MSISPTIFIVDDDPSVLAALEEMLSSFGYTGILAKSVAETRQLLAAAHLSIQLLITDFQLPDGTGLDIVRVFSQRYPSVPIIGMSADSGNEDRFRSVGVIPFLTKPMTEQELIQMVRLAIPVESQAISDELQPEYTFDYSKGIRGKYYADPKKGS